ncbi:hypothetical protein RND71_021666 [Anisodus tanguticus]|uniref:Uncharacterized protein n=1 Tax=Anisodus tanguticus TaxID=243964 RepID=A0AAE1V8G1_9SOLA|nr:hypothetical protein RND71_021666 [Anisodus tanguticus]
MDSSSTGSEWTEWLEGWRRLTCETLFQKINARHLQDPLPLPPLNGLTCMVTVTSGIGLEIARKLAESGAHLVMAIVNMNSLMHVIGFVDSQDMNFLTKKNKFSQELHCMTTKPSKEAYNVGTSQQVWDKSLEMVGLPTDVDMILQGKETHCRYGANRDRVLGGSTWCPMDDRAPDAELLFDVNN